MYVATLEWKEACSEVNWKNSELIEGMCCFLNIEDRESLYSTNFIDMETTFLYTWMSTQWLANIIFYMKISNFIEYYFTYFQLMVSIQFWLDHTNPTFITSNAD